MATLLVTYDLRAPGRDYNRVYEYLRSFNHCHGMDSIWLLDTPRATVAVRDELLKLVDPNDKVFVVRITKDWGSFNFLCADWLNRPERTY